MSKHQFERYVRGFAIVRTDHDPSGWMVKVVKVLLDFRAAEAEVEPLTALNGPKGVTYELQVTHVFGDPGATGADDEAD